MDCCLLISCHISTKGSDEASFCEHEFSFVFVEAPTNFSFKSLKAEGCSGEHVLAVEFSRRVS